LEEENASNMRRGRGGRGRSPVRTALVVGAVASRAGGRGRGRGAGREQPPAAAPAPATAPATSSAPAPTPSSQGVSPQEQLPPTSSAS